MSQAAPSAPNPRYRGRFAPSPTGPLHLGSLVAALASHADARAHGGTWLVRMEDIDAPRMVAGADQQILHALHAYGLSADAPPVWQSDRHALYQAAFDRLVAAGHVYPCACTRREIADSVLNRHAPRHAELIYPGTCARGLAAGRTARAWRLRVPDTMIAFDDRNFGRVEQNLAREVGDFVIRRADGQWAYQLAVVVDDAEQGVTHVVRGADLLDSTVRQIYLQRLLDVPTPRYLHVPVVEAADGEKLSKQNGAMALPLDPQGIARTLRQASGHLATFDGFRMLK